MAARQRSVAPPDCEAVHCPIFKGIYLCKVGKRCSRQTFGGMASFQRRKSVALALEPDAAVDAPARRPGV